MKGKSKKIIIVIILLLVTAALIWLRLDRVYEKSLKEYNLALYPTDERMNQTITNINKNITLGDEVHQHEVVSLKPGETHRGFVAVKNHQNNERLFVMNHKMELVDENESETIEESAIEMADDASVEKTSSDEDQIKPYLDSYPKDPFSLGPEEFQIIDYEIVVPEDTPYGNYEGLLRFYDYDQELNENQVNIITAVGIKIRLEVTDSPKYYEYKMIIQNPEDLAKTAVIKNLLFILSVIFSLLCIVFLYIAIKSKK